MDNHKLERVANRLKREKQKLIGMIDKIEENGINQALGESIGELSVYDNHPADLGTESFERSKDLALCDNEHLLIADIDHALDKIKAGSYGLCDVCRSSISAERLHALPWAATCVKCQEQLDSQDIAIRPIEEFSLQYPFGRTFLDHSTKQQAGFDGEDSLQAVWNFGSSDSPQDLPGSHDFSDLDIDPYEQVGIVDPVDNLPSYLDGSHDLSITPHSSKHKRPD